MTGYTSRDIGVKALEKLKSTSAVWVWCFELICLPLSTIYTSLSHYYSHCVYPLKTKHLFEFSCFMAVSLVSLNRFKFKLPTLKTTIEGEKLKTFLKTANKLFKVQISAFPIIIYKFVLNHLPVLHTLLLPHTLHLSMPHSSTLSPHAIFFPLVFSQWHHYSPPHCTLKHCLYPVSVPHCCPSARPQCCLWL